MLVKPLDQALYGRALPEPEAEVSRFSSVIPDYRQYYRLIIFGNETIAEKLLILATGVPQDEILILGDDEVDADSVWFQESWWSYEEMVQFTGFLYQTIDGKSELAQIFTHYIWYWLLLMYIYWKTGQHDF